MFKYFGFNSLAYKMLDLIVTFLNKVSFSDFSPLPSIPSLCFERAT